MNVLFITEREGAISFLVRVTPRAKRDEIVGAVEGALKVKLAAPPVEGAANEALTKFLADRLGVHAAQVEILSGRTAKMKRVRVIGISASEAHRRLQA
ncbi:MAG: DUF167 domain-containing protein [Anaerolineae bacterium]|jgi:uncharacterized protein (TIGR00251 family)|nr:DUF167 domain-containing protein [Anaerolineae bacterium]